MLLFTCQFRLEANNYFFQEDSISEAINIFENEEFSMALPLFEKILHNDQDNKMVNYYYGACLVETGIFSVATNNSLLKAVSGNTPDKVLYYVGLYFKNKKLWSSSLKYLNLYKSVATDENISGLDILTLINECTENLKPVEETTPDATIYEHVFPDTITNNSTILDKIKETKDNESVITDEPIIDELGEVDNSQAFKEPGLIESLLLDEPEVVVNSTILVEPEVIKNPKLVKPIIEKPEAIYFQINSFIAYTSVKHFINDKAIRLFQEGQKVSLELDSIIHNSDSLRTDYENSECIASRNSIAEKIIEAEKVSLSLNSERNQLYLEARELEMEYWNKASQHEIDSFMAEVEKSRLELNSEKNDAPQLVISKTFSEIDPSIFFTDRKVQADDKNKPKGEELLFRIQIGAYSRGLPDYIDRLYRKLALLRKIDNYTDEKGIVVYSTGRLTNFDDAVKMQKQVRQEGIKDAFVVPYLNGKRITISEAKELTKEK